jgi:hypothetical protein
MSLLEFSAVALWAVLFIAVLSYRKALELKQDCPLHHWALLSGFDWPPSQL